MSSSLEGKQFKQFNLFYAARISLPYRVCIIQLIVHLAVIPTQRTPEIYSTELTSPVVQGSVYNTATKAAIPTQAMVLEECYAEEFCCIGLCQSCKQCKTGSAEVGKEGK
jgi:hypothetical protein